MTTTPREPTLDEIIAFLLGEGELNGRWFGEEPPPAHRGMFWWRTELRAAWNRRTAPAAAGEGARLIHNGDHAQFEIDNAGKDPKERPDWPLPSFDARDWAEAFCKIAKRNGHDIDEGWVISWFANALMRGFDEANSRSPQPAPASRVDDRRLGEEAPTTDFMASHMLWMAENFSSFSMLHRQIAERLRTLEADARRYRWLRGRFGIQGPQMSGQHPWYYKASGLLRGPSLDAAVDAAIERDSPSAEAAPKCETCGGSGQIQVQVQHVGYGRCGVEPCPDCERGGGK